MSTALVVDDSKTIRTILRRVLVEEHFDVLEAGNGIEALDVLDHCSAQPSLVLADWNMPEMSGLELIKALRKRRDLWSLKIVMVTTESESGRIAAALAAGADEYVMKPFTKQILMEKLQLIGAVTSESA